MLEKIENYFSKWSIIKQGGYLVGLQTKIPIDRDASMKGLEYIKKNFPELSESRQEEEQNAFSLESYETDFDKRLYFKIIDFKRIVYVWGVNRKLEFKSYMKKLFDCIQEGFNINSYNVNVIEMQFTVISEWEGNHYKVIHDAFLKNTQLANLFEINKILQDDIYLRGMIDDKRICIVGCESNVSDKEIMHNKFKDDLLRLYVSVGQTRNLPDDKNISDTFIKHSKVVTDFIIDKFFPNIVDPIDEALVKLSKVI